MLRSLAALALIGLMLPGTALARATSRAWVTGAVVRVSATAITVRGTVTLAVSTAVGSTKSTLDGNRAITCDVTAPALVRGYRAGNRVRITCDGLTLSKIVRA
jgi:hypothetical protein